ncbi:hypothetical protein EJB05_07500, partial [Eragrostis curvula]
MALPGCQASCGGVNIPYPFGVGANCSRDAGFEITCNGTTPFLADTTYQVLNMSVAPSVARVQLPIAWTCYNASGSIVNSTDGKVKFNPQGVYRISDARNELVIIGCNTMAYIRSKPSSSSIYWYDIYTGCVAYCNSAESTVNGRCVGQGCCKVDFPPGLTDNNVVFSDWSRKEFVNFSPCSYGFLVDREHYTFRRADLKMDRDSMMPVWLDWAIRPPNDTDTLTCADANKNGTSYACKSQNSNCTDAVNGPGYSCQCADGYEGNPYIDGGCTNINECMDPTKYTCYGRCEDTEGSYKCTCPRGSHGKPKEARCEPNFPRVAQITIDERAREMFDAEIASPENIDFLEKVGSIAIACLKEDMDERPNMKQVVENLQLVRREWKQRQGTHGDQVADEISMESPASLTMNATGAETPGDVVFVTFGYIIPF